MGCLYRHALPYRVLRCLPLLAVTSALAADRVTVVPLNIDGQPAPGMPAGVTYGGLADTPFLTQSGQIAFKRGVVGAGIASYTSGIWSGVSGTPLVLPGDFIPAFPNSPVRTASLAGFDSSGRALVEANNGVTYGLWTSSANGLVPLALSGFGSSALPLGVSYTSTWPAPAFTQNGQMAFLASLGGDGVDATNNYAVISGTPEAQSIIARTGSQVPGTANGDTISALPTYSSPVINDGGHSLFVATIAGNDVPSNNNQFLFFSDGSTIRQIAHPTRSPFYNGNPLFGGLTINDAGQVAFRTYQTFDVQGRFPGFSTIWAGTPDNITQIASSTGNVSDPLLNSRGQILYTGSTAQGSGLLLRQPDGAVQLQAEVGSHAPGTPSGVSFSFFSPIAINNRGQFLTYAGLTGTELSSANAGSLWASFAGRLYLLARVGQPFDLGNGQTKTISTFVAERGGVGEDGRGIIFNDKGQIVFPLIFNDGTQGAFLFTLPTTIPGDANLDGVVDTTDFKLLYANLDHSGDLAHGDFNGDGWVNYKDFQILEENFGRAIENLPAVPASEIAAFESAAAGVPEPAGLCLLVPFLLPRSRRR